MSVWTLTCNGSTKDAATWGIRSMKRKLQSFEQDKVTFIVDGALVNADPIFAQWSTVTIKRNGVQWFVGIVTKVPRAGVTTQERYSYELSGPWWYLDNLVFQQEWQMTTVGSAELVSTLSSMVIIGQQEDGTGMDLGQMMATVLQYCLTTCGAAVPAIAPFQTGMMTPDITIPFSQVTDKTCAQIIKICLQWVPDAIGWFDYSVSPPMLNIARRGDLAAVTLVAFDGPVSSIEIASRDDLVVPAVVAKYDQNNTVDGVSYACQFVDIYPVHAPDPALRNLVQHIDLIGGNATFTKQPITVTDRPVIPADEDALPWIFRKEPWLNAQASPGVYFYDWGGISIFSITTTLDPKDPQVVNPDPDFPELDTLTEELVSGNVQDWMKENDHVYAAKVLLTIYLSYAGSDATTAALFTFDPANPKTPTAPGQGYFVRYYGITATNAQTQIYQELTSFQESEPVPVGLAQNLYEGLSVLHYEGTIEITESECTGLVGLQNVLNLSGGRAEWTAMVGQVFSITEDIDTGKTSVRIGPNAMMSLEQWTEMLRAARGILFSWKLDQRTTGKVGSPTQVQGAQHSADNTSPTIPATSTSAQLPWSVTLRKVGAAWQAKVFLNSTLYSDNSLGNNIAVTGLDSWFTCVPSSSSPDKIWLKGTVVGLSIDVALSCSGATIQSLGMGSSGFDTTVTTPWASHSFVQNDAADPPNQTIFNVLLATISADAHGNPIVKPNCTANLVLIIQALAGIGAIYPIPATNSAS